MRLSASYGLILKKNKVCLSAPYLVCLSAPYKIQIGEKIRCLSAPYLSDIQEHPRSHDVPAPFLSYHIPIVKSLGASECKRSKDAIV